MVASASMADPAVLYRFIPLKRMNIGVSSTATGSIWVTRNPSSITLRPRNRYFAIPYEAGTARTTEIMVAPIEIIKLLAKDWNILKSPVSTCAA